MESVIIASREDRAGSLVSPFPSLEAVGEKFLELADVSPKTKLTYRKDLGVFFSWLRSNSIASPTRSDIVAYKEYLTKEKKVLTGTGNDKHETSLKATSAKGYLQAVKSLFSWASAEFGALDVAKGIKPPKLSKEFKKFNLTEEQARSLLAEARKNKTLEGLRNYALIRLLLTTGLRTIEVSRALVCDIQPKGNFIALMVQGKGQSEKGDFVKLPPKTFDAIQDYLNARGNTETEAPLFASSGIASSGKGKGEALRTESISRIVKTLLKKAGLNSRFYTAHSLRHTTATLNLLHGGTLEETKQLLRHANINTTLIYSHSLDRAKNQSEKRIEDILG